MSDLEKLRVLLREARETLRDFAENYDCDSDAHRYGTTCRACDAKAVKQRIDDVLAQPPRESAADLRKRLWPHSAGRQGHGDGLGEVTSEDKP